jgi:hypothetical protein
MDEFRSLYGIDTAITAVRAQHSDAQLRDPDHVAYRALVSLRSERADIEDGLDDRRAVIEGRPTRGQDEERYLDGMLLPASYE